MCKLWIHKANTFICNICHTKHYVVELYFKLCVSHCHFFLLFLKTYIFHIFCQLPNVYSYSGLGKLIVCTEHWHLTWYTCVTPSHLHQTFASHPCLTVKICSMYMSPRNIIYYQIIRTFLLFNFKVKQLKIKRKENFYNNSIVWRCDDNFFLLNIFLLE